MNDDKVFNTLQKRYQRLIARHESGAPDEALLEETEAFIEDARRAGASVSALNQRSQLRAWMRFLAAILYEETDKQPDVTLQPLARGRLTTGDKEKRVERPAIPAWGWGLIGAAGLAIILAMLFTLRFLASIDQETPTPVPSASPTAAVEATAAPSLVYPHTVQEGETLFSIAAQYGADPLRIASRNNVAESVALEAGQKLSVPLPNPYLARVQLSTEQAVEASGFVFCAGTETVYATFTFDDLASGTSWSWKVVRDEETVAEETMGPWRERSEPVAIPILSEADGILAGQYTLIVMVDGAEALSSSFKVLSTPPHVTDLRLSTVPDGADRETLEPGARVLYATYTYAGRCAGQAISRTITFEGETAYTDVKPWTGQSEGEGQVAYYRSDDLPLRRGEYVARIRIGAEASQETSATIAGPMPPSFGDLTVAMGVEPDGTPILGREDEQPFGSTTKIVYAIFKYAGLTEGLPWRVVWTRNGEEIEEEARLWDPEAVATKDTHWVALYLESGDPLGGGTYTVSLSIEDEPQTETTFIIYYPPAEGEEVSP